MAMPGVGHEDSFKSMLASIDDAERGIAAYRAAAN
jgi:hypothetical protein